MAPAGADQPAPSVASLTSKVNADATHIHQLTEQLDEARLHVSSTSARLAAVTRQHDATMQQMSANREVLLQQAVRAYMQGGGVSVDVPSASASADLALSTEYMKVATGDVSDTGDQLHQIDVALRVDQVTLGGAQQANLQATAQLEALRSNALSVATTDQAQLDSLQTQLAAQARTRAATARATQGVPVNNGLITVVQRAAGLPIATPVATTTVAAPVQQRPPVVSVGPISSQLGGPWLALRECESSDNYAENTGNGYYGAYQFSQSTWSGLGFPGRPDLEPPSMQDAAAMKDQADAGWGQWPACSAALGL